MGEWWRRLMGSLRRKALMAELEEEMRTHLEMKAAEGDSDAARRQFGNSTRHLEDSRAAWGWPRLEGWLIDFRYAFRVLARKPAFTATVVLTLTLGIGASSTIYSLIDAVLIRPLPYPNSERLVAIEEANADDPRFLTPVSPGRLQDWQRLASTFEAIGGSSSDTVTETSGIEPERIAAASVSPGFFSAMGTHPSLGRAFSAEEERFGGPLAIIISDSLWRRRFSSDPGVLGRTLRLMDQSHVIVGVMPPWFRHPSASTEVWTAQRVSPELLGKREARSNQCVGLLKAGVTVDQARADLAAVQKQLAIQYPKTDAGWTIAIKPLKDQLVGNVRLALWLLTGSVSLLLLIACANVACLLLARLNGRAAEIATRCALGAGRAAISRQLFVEGLAYAVTGGLLGMLAAFAGIDGLRMWLPDVPRIAELQVDARMLLLIAGLSIFAALVFSVAPMLQTFRRDIGHSAMRGGRGLVGNRQRLTRFLVTAQLALTTALLIGSGLLLRSLTKLQETPLGFRPEGVLTLRVTASINERPESTMQRHQRILETLSHLPGVKSVAMTSGLPGVNPTWPREFHIDGEAERDGRLRFATNRVVTSAYFETVGIPIRNGRSCRMTTDLKEPFESLVNQSFVNRYLQGREALGRTIDGGPSGTPTRIVGVVGDAREDGHGLDPQPLIYVCGFLRYWPDSAFLVRADSAVALAGPVRQAVQAIEPSRPVHAVHPLGARLSDALSQARFRALLIGVFSIVALLLAAIGLYGVMSYMVSQRSREIGVRLALGARPMAILLEIVRSAGLLTAAGMAVGIGIAAVASRVLGGLLYGVRASDVVSYLAAVGVLLVVALLACLIPGRRAVSIDPALTLRDC